MATFTESDAQDLLQAELESDNNTPDATSDDYLMRRLVLKSAIMTWEHYNGIRWRCLYKVDDDSLVGDGTTTVFTAPADFIDPVGFIQTLSDESAYTNWTIVDPKQAELFAGDTSTRFCYITGVIGARQINFSVAPDAADQIILTYYKQAIYPTTTTSIIEMENPLYVVKYAAAQVQLNDQNLIAYYTKSGEAQTLLDEMAAMNEALPAFQEQYVPDLSAGFGD